MASEFDKLLEDVAREVEPSEMTGKMVKRCVEAVLKRRLLPLLEAGQAVRTSMEEMLSRQGFIMQHTLEGQTCVAWDAAKQKAMDDHQKGRMT